MAFIVDVRRGNFDFHLMYKALFEMSADRAEFVSRLFSRPRPEGVTAKSTAEDIFAAIANEQATDTLYSRNMRAIVNHLTKVHQFQLSSADILRMQHILARRPPTARPSARRRPTRTADYARATYAELMWAADRGFEHSFLASEEAFQWMKQFEWRTARAGDGDFPAGPSCAPSANLAERQATVSAFYLSNVEEYLKQDGKQKTFCENASALPIDASSTFIRSSRSGTPDFGFELVSELGSMTSDLAMCN